MPAGHRVARSTKRLDGAVDHDRVPRHRQVSRPLQHQVLGAGPGHDAAAATLRLAQVRGPLDDEHRGGDPAQQPLGLVGGVGEARTCVLGQDRRTGGLPGEADDVLELLGGVRLGEHLVEEELGELRPVLGPGSAGCCRATRRSRRARRRSAARLRGVRRRAGCGPAPRARSPPPPGRGRGGGRRCSSACQALKQMLTSTARGRPRGGPSPRGCPRRRRGRRSDCGSGERPDAPVARRVDGHDAVVPRQVGDLCLPGPAVDARVDRHEEHRGLGAVAEGLLARRTPSTSTYPSCPAPVPSCTHPPTSGLQSALQPSRNRPRARSAHSIHPDVPREGDPDDHHRTGHRPDRRPDRRRAGRARDRHGRADGVRRQLRRRPRRHHGRGQRAPRRAARALPRRWPPVRPTPASSRTATGTDPRYVDEWLRGQAAGGYVEYDAGQRDVLDDARAGLRADRPRPARSSCPVPSSWRSARSRRSPQIEHAFRTAPAYGWHEHDEDVFTGCERFFRPGYLMHLLTEWIPALEGVPAKLSAVRRVADLGCGHGASTLLMAEAFPASTSSARTTTRARSRLRASARRRRGR